MHIRGRGTIPAVILAATLLVSGACNSGRSQKAFCTAVKANLQALNSHAVGVGVDNQAIMTAHVAAYKAIDAKAPSPVSTDTHFVYTRQKKFTDAWRAGGFKTNTMPEFDENLDTHYKAVDDYAAANCGVTVT